MGHICVAPGHENGGHRNWSEVAIFLAGGITGSDDWQSHTAERIARNTPDNVWVLNPRRPYDMDPTDVETAHEQIWWEYEGLKDSDFVLFWFPSPGPCPITLFELGKEVVKAQARGTFNNLFVGCSPDYNRRLDVEYQLKLAGYPEEIHNNLDIMTTDLIKMFKE